MKIVVDIFIRVCYISIVRTTKRRAIAMKRRHARKAMKVVRNTMITMMLVVAFWACSWYETHYTREAIVTQVSNDVVIVVDGCNYVWQFNKEGLKVNDKVKLTMNTMNTDTNVLDDTIEDVIVIK